ncbi:MAG TPA: family 16 glycosylhydrolase, partial [Candidatus Luteococcus avicola]|nr:family 16 glycosylhydrolase [Candidatus Luteococcus avicola]
APAPALGATVPAPAATAGFNNLVLRDEFDNLDNFDLTGTGQPDKLWYTDRAFGYGRLPASDLSVNNGVLTLDQTKDTLNYGFASVSPTTHKGRSYQYGYFEIRMAHDPSNSVRSKSYPSFWSISRDHLVAPASKPMWSELNFYEAYHEDYKPYPNFFVGTVHDWRNGNPKTDNMSGGNNTYTLTNVDYTQMHVYSCLWMPGKIVWYFDGRPLLTQLYGPNEYPTPNYANNPIGTFNQLANETNGMALILGTGINNPMRIDYVRVWK